jgi:hypothetical protein
VIGASPPTGTRPSMICRLCRRSIVRQGLIALMPATSAKAGLSMNYMRGASSEERGFRGWSWWRAF